MSQDVPPKAPSFRAGLITTCSNAPSGLTRLPNGSAKSAKHLRAQS